MSNTPFTLIPISHFEMDDLRTKEAELLDKELEADRIWSILHERDQNFNKMVSRAGVVALQEFIEPGYTYFGGMLPVYWSRFNPTRANFIWGVRTDLYEERPELALMGMKLKLKSLQDTRNHLANIHLIKALDFTTKEHIKCRRGCEYLWKIKRNEGEGLQITDWRMLNNELLEEIGFKNK